MPITQQQIENQRALVAALRSGKYQQGINSLRSGDSEFCCLGVACDISELGHWDLDAGYVYVTGDYDSYTEEGDENRLLPSVRDYYGWSSVDGIVDIRRHAKVNNQNHDGMTLTSLLELNDDGFTFNQIADIIEARLVQEIE